MMLQCSINNNRMKVDQRLTSLAVPSMGAQRVERIFRGLRTARGQDVWPRDGDTLTLPGC